MYTEESKYSREDDNFDRKLTIFNDLCDRVGIPQEAKIKGFPTMLRGIALNFYYRNKATYVTFNGICNAIRNHFEGPKYKRGVLIKWNATTLKTVIIKSEGKSTEDCLQLLLNDLRHLQYSLNANLRNNDFLYNKLIVACQDVAACQAAYSNPPATLTGLMNSLRSLIITYGKINGTIRQPANVFLQPTEQPANIFFTDRRYHRSMSRPSSSNNRYGNNARTCFVCKKRDCWLTRHTKKERNKTKKEFKRRVHQYLVDNDINNFNKDIVPTTTSGNFFYDDYGVKHFMTSNGPIPIKTAKNIVTSINNDAFAYSLTSSIEPSSMEPSTARRGNIGNKSNNNKGKSATYLYDNNPPDLTIDIDFLNCHFDDNG